jgi:hypothetical protein
MDKYNHIITDTRSPKENEFILHSSAKLDGLGHCEDVREMMKYIQDLGNLDIIRIPDWELPTDHQGEKYIGFRIVKREDN